MNYGILKMKAGGYVFTKFTVFFVGERKKIDKGRETGILTKFIFFFVGKIGNGTAGHSSWNSRICNRFAVPTGRQAATLPVRFWEVNHQR